MDAKNLSPAYSLPLLCIGLGIIAVCVIVPQAEANKKLAADREQLQRDLAYVDQQVAVNQEFIDRFGSDPDLTERLAQRQMKQIRTGTTILNFTPAKAARVRSMADMLRVARPDPVPAYVPPSGLLGTICADDRRQLYVVGMGLFLVAVTLVIGGAGNPETT
jgi:hypothetical protein